MAEAWGSAVSNWRGGVNAWVASETETTATIHVVARWQSLAWGFDVQNGNTAIVKCDGQSSGTQSVGGVYAAKGTIVTSDMLSQDFIVTKGGSGRNVSCYGSFHLGGYQVGDSGASVDVYVSERKRTAHGTPSFSASKTTVHYGESIKLSWAKSGTQGNADFDHFELWQGSTKLYSGSNASYTVTPSDVTGAKGGTAIYMVKEIHEWYGTYPSTEAYVTITVRSGVVTVYDDDRSKKVGLVSAYDENGEHHYVLITAYDENGKPYNVV